jgi:D-alanyl-D-alanine carboxypeptidase
MEEKTGVGDLYHFKWKKKVLSILMIGILGMHSLSAFAEDAMTEEEEKAASYQTVPETNQIEGWPEGPFAYADSAIVMEMESGAILYEKQADKAHYPASITKLLTTLVALENAQLDDPVTFSEDSVSFLEWDDANIGMIPGEVISMEDALYAVLLASANEVSYAVGESVGTNRLGGDYQTFLNEMNETAKKLGCENSNFTNTNGLHDDNHYTTARDMALIAAAVYARPEFATFMSQLQYEIGPTNLVAESRVFQQNHKMMWPESLYAYDNCTGGKTGYTDQAKTTLVTMAEQDGMKLVTVVMYDYGADAYTDTRQTFDYVAGHFKKVDLTQRTANAEIAVAQSTSPYVILPKTASVEEIEEEIVPLEDGIRSAEIIYRYKDQIVGKEVVTLTDEGYKKYTKMSQTTVTQPETETEETSEQKEEQETASTVQTTRKFRMSKPVLVGAAGIGLGVILSYWYRRRRRPRWMRKRKRINAPSRPRRIRHRRRRR